MARTDIHRPGAMNSSDYIVLALIYVFEDVDNEGNIFMNAEMEPLSGRFEELDCPMESTWEGHKRMVCDHCGHSVKWTCIIEHKSTGQILEVGRDCVKRFLTINWTLTEKIIRDRIDGKNNIQRWLRIHPDQTELMAWAESDNGIAGDMRRKLYRYGSLSDKQIEFMKKLHQEQIERVAMLAAKVICDCPEGKIEVCGKVVSIKTVENPFSRWGSITKMLIEDPRGFKVWGTKPESIYDAQKGDLVRFSATIERSEKDASFGIFKRPTKAVNLSREAVPC